MNATRKIPTGRQQPDEGANPTSPPAEVPEAGWGGTVRFGRATSVVSLPPFGKLHSPGAPAPAAELLGLGALSR